MFFTKGGVFTSGKELFVMLLYNSQYIKLLNLKSKPYQRLANWILGNEAAMTDYENRMKWPSLKCLVKSLALAVRRLRNN